MNADPKSAAGRAFVRSLNILLKYARLYGYEHARTVEQLTNAWQELRTAVPLGNDQGLLLGTSGAQLLLDGVPLEGMPAEKQFAQLLSAAGLASVQFLSSVTEEELGRFVHAFPTGKAKPAELARLLKAALEGARGIRVNEICFVATDSRLKGASAAAQLAAASLGGDKDDLKNWLNDPHKLLELLAAAQGSTGGGPIGTAPGSTGTGADGAIDPAASGGAGSSGSEAPGAEAGGTDDAGAGGAGGGSAGVGSGGTGYGATAVGIPGNVGFGSGSGSGGPGPGGFGGPIAGAVTGGTGGTGRGARFAQPTEDEIFGILGALTRFGRLGAAEGSGVGTGGFQEEIKQMPGRTQDIMRQALASLAAQAPNLKPDESLLVQLAEFLAIRFALERFERGEVKVNAVRQMLDRMNQEIENLRKILGAHEDKMSDAGILSESHREILDRQFWAAVPENAKRTVLLSNEAWCIPPRNVQSYIGQLLKDRNNAEAASVLRNYAACVESEDADARKKTALGLAALAELYSKADPKLIGEALRHLGLRLSVEQDKELRDLVSAAFVRMSQEAASSRHFPAMEQALDLIAGVESQRPGIARTLRPKMGIEERIPEFVEEALRARQMSAGLTNVLKLLPQTTVVQLAARFNRCSLRDDAEHVANLAADLGEEPLDYLRSTMRGGLIAEAVEMAGLLAKLDPQAVGVFLPGRMKDFPRAAQDRVVRQISGSGSPRRAHILLELIDHVDPLVMPLVIDEIGVTGDREALGKLLTIVDGDLPHGGGTYLRVKAIEALGRIHAPESVTTLKRIAESKKMLGWVHPQELRIAALQALVKLEPDWARNFLAKSGIDPEDLTLAPLDIPTNSKFVRQRRHTRVRLQRPVKAVSLNLKENCLLEIKTASMTGGVATINRHLAPGTQVQLKLQVGMRNLQATALMRDYRAQDMAFEIVDMQLEERSKLRRMLTGNLPYNPNAVENDPTAAHVDGVAAAR